MIERINFLEKKRTVITYGFLLLSIGSALALVLLLTGWHTLRQAQLGRQLTTLRTEVTTLEQKREELLRKVRGSNGEQVSMELENLLRQNPSWPKLLETLSRLLPGPVWLGSLKTSGREIILNGLAKNPQALTQFLSNLEAAPEFTAVKLVTSKEEGPGKFPFTISCGIQ